MSFTFQCPACDVQLSAASDQAGAQAVCPACDVILAIPDPLAASSRRAGAIRGTESRAVLRAEEAPLRFRLDEGSREAEMDMTPMVDVTFLLLIFFMVTAAFAMQKSFEVPAPREEQASARPIDEVEEDADYVIVRVDEFNTFFVSAAVWDEEREAPSQQDLLVRLRQARRGSGSVIGANRMLVMASGEARHEKVVAALDAGAAVGMEDVKLITVEEEEP